MILRIGGKSKSQLKHRVVQLYEIERSLTTLRYHERMKALDIVFFMAHEISEKKERDMIIAGIIEAVKQKEVRHGNDRFTGRNHKI